MLKPLFIASLLLSSLSVLSQEIDPSQVIKSVEIQRISNPPGIFQAEIVNAMNKAVVELPGVPGNPLNEIAMYVDGLIALGKKIWPIIQAGRPVITTTGLAPSLSVLPEGKGSAEKPELYEMENWSAPKVVSYRISYKNLYNSEVIGFTYTVFFQYGGSYQDKGKYITSLKVQASEVYAGWGFNFDAASELINVANIGSIKNPVASAIIQINYKAKGFLNEVRNASSIYVDGHGTIKALNQ